MFGKPPAASIIVPTYNGGERLRECLASLVKQDYPNFDITVVDNDSTDDTRQIVESFSGVIYIHFDRIKSSYAARNEGVRRSSGEVLFFFDSDQTAPPNFLSQLLQAYVSKDPHHIYPGRLQSDPRVPAEIRRFSPNNRCENPPKRVGTACVAIPRALFVELGGFNETLLSGGDYEFFDRACSMAQVHRMPEIACLHYDCREISDYLLRQERYAFGSCLQASHAGERLPSTTRQVGKLIHVVSKSMVLALITPLRKPPGDILLSWRIQLLECREQYHVLLGLLKYHRGQSTAGDLPATQVNATLASKQ